jgi:hypothetical protein
MLFIHSQRYQWHNDDPYYDGKAMIRNFQIPYLEQQGYVNLRCVWVLGCPEEIHPLTDVHRDDVHAGEYFKTGFMQLFPGVKIPEAVGTSCCAQFSLTRWKVQERPKSDYERYRKWLLETPLEDDLSGRIMEYSWHSKLIIEGELLSTGLNPANSDIRDGTGPLSYRFGMLLQCLWLVRPHLQRC